MVNHCAEAGPSPESNSDGPELSPLGIDTAAAAALLSCPLLSWVR